MIRERMSRPSSSVPNQCACEGKARRAGRSIEAGSCGAIQGANRAKTTKMVTKTIPVAASGLWLAVRRIEMAAVDICQRPLTAKTAKKGREGRQENLFRVNPSRGVRVPLLMPFRLQLANSAGPAKDARRASCTG